MGLLQRNEQLDLISKLEKLPNIIFNWNAIRAALLQGLPVNVAGHVVATGIANVDLRTLVDTLEGPGMQLKDGGWPILTVIENGIQLASGLALERELREIHLLAITRQDVDRREGVSLEALLKARTGFQSVSLWAQRLFETIRPICRVDVDGQANGSGFLIGSNLVLTNHHVVHNQDGSPIPPARLGVRFDHHQNPDGTSSPGIPYAVLDEELPKSPPQELDFAVLRLGGTPADDPAGGVQNNPRRGFLTPKGLALATGDPLFIIQHPQGRAMEIAFDLVTDVQGTRVQYKTNTEPGSSGSPCFDKAWNLVALHHSANDMNNPTANVATLMSHIITRPDMQPLLKS